MRAGDWARRARGRGARPRARPRPNDSGVDLRLVGDQRVVLRPLQISGLMPAFQVHATVPDAIAALTV